MSDLWETFSAREMFSELGYAFINHEEDGYLDYVITCYDSPNDEYYIQDIIFNLKERTVEAFTNDEDYEPEINEHERKAINKQIDELGWETCQELI